MDEAQIKKELDSLKELARIQSIRIDNVENANRILIEKYKALWVMHENAMNKHEEIADKNTELINNVSKTAMEAVEEIRKYLEGTKPMQAVK